MGTSGALLDIDCMPDDGNLSVEYEVGIRGTEGVSDEGALLNNELRGLLDFVSTLLRRDRLSLT